MILQHNLGLLNVFLAAGLFLPCLSQASDETLTITTYYPSPYGVYNEFTTYSNTNLAIQGGNVGIGTTNPATKVYIVDDGGEILQLERTGDICPGILSMGMATGMFYTGMRGGFIWARGSASHTNDNLSLAAGLNGSILFGMAEETGGAAEEFMRIANNGYVGIGTTNPTTKLNLVPDFGSSDGFLIGNNKDTSNLSYGIYIQGGDGGWGNNVIGSLVLYPRSSANATNYYLPSQAFRFGMDSAGNNRAYISSSDGIRFVTGSSTDNNTNISNDLYNKIRMIINSSGNVGIGTLNPGYTLTVNGTAWCTATAWASDLRWKENITALNNPLEKLLRLRGVEFDWKRKEFKDQNFPEGRQIGIIAQELDKEFPELVMTDKDGYKSIAYDKFTVVLLEAIKAQQVQMNNQQTRIDNLEAEIVKLKK